MPTHGNARTLTIRALNNREAFKRSGFAMTAIQGASESLGELPEEWKTNYSEAAREGRIAYTVKSYRTPILWVERDGFGVETIVCPSVNYSRTTSNHQSMARVYVKL